MGGFDPFTNNLEASASVSAVAWVQAALTGTMAASIAVIAVAAVGFGMMSGRIDMRRATTTILGCFVVFAAPSIADGILRATSFGARDAPSVSSIGVEEPAPLPEISSQPDYDPYAGAAMPVQ